MVKVNITAVGFSEQQLKLVYETQNAIEKVVNSDRFKSKVLEFRFNGEKTFYFRKTVFGKYVDRPYTNEEVYRIITTAKEKQGDTDEGEIDLYPVLLKDVNPNVVGYGYPSSKEVYTYRNWFESFTVAEYAGHLTHEWLHKLGFSHSHHHNRKRKYSIPYAIGDMVEELIEDGNV